MTANPQTNLDFGRGYRLDDEFRKSMHALKDAYDAAGNLVVAGATGIKEYDLPKMFEPGSGRHLRYKAVFAIGALASLELRRRALEPLARYWGFGLCQPKPMTAEERAARCEMALRSLGPVGEQALMRALEALP